ncbi:MAG: glycosyltransferase family 4 protein [Clostridiales bacterium]|nr:glycosyltransferase family 4 protein [Clostridiales bacterium]MDO4350515.1 glycosyltransferase family 4 protein [Eubacteriales bacterium]MDY4008558.1 glycosyltransferase family 4 protein [Candidatus Limiplasma sp.]
MKPRVLFVATVLRAHVLVFHVPYMRWFQEQGYEVHLCCRNDMPEPVESVPGCDRFIELPFSRSPFSVSNVKVFGQLKRLIDEGGYSLIHCNTPVGGMLGRLAARRARRRGTKVVYTAHGFHFFTGAPVKNWLLFYPVERFLSRFTDLLITINGEDYARARRFHAQKTALVSGVGVDLTRFEGPLDCAAVRRALGLGEEDTAVICVGEHSVRKNHETALRAVAPLERAHLLFCGVGEREEALKALAGELGMAERAHFLGFRRDVPALLRASDIFLFPSLQEGLPVAQMEAMAAGLPCVVSNVRGNADLIQPGEGGYLNAPRDWKGFSEDVKRLMADAPLRREMGNRNRRVMQGYSLDEALRQMAALYQELLARD